jgi:hypothetical protein
MVPEEGLEPSRGYPHRILSPRNHILNGIEQYLLVVFPMDFRLVYARWCHSASVVWAQLRAQCESKLQTPRVSGFEPLQ